MCGRHRAAWAALALCLWSSVVWVGAGEGRRTRLVTKTEGKEEGEVLPRPGASTREREIAAIFRGVAYGVPTTTTTTTTTSTTTSPHTTPTTSRPVATSPSLHRQQKGAGTKAPTAGNGPRVPASRRDEDQREGGGVPSNTAPPLEGRRDVVNSTAVSLGPAWSARVYLTAGLFGVAGVAALCLMPKAASASPLLAAPHHFLLHLLVLASAACRCLHLLHAAPHFSPVLPPALLTAAEEGAWPLLTAGLAVVAWCALRGWLSPARPRLALILVGAAAAHLASLAVIHVGVVVLKASYEPLSFTASIVAITCGGLVGVVGVWAVWPLGRSQAPMGGLDEVSGESCGGPSPPANLLLAAAFVQLLLVSSRLYILTTPPSLSPAWAWWCRLTLPHAFELLLSGLLLAAAALASDPPAVFPYCGCCQKRTAEVVHPSAVKMVHPLGVYTVEEVATAAPKNQHARTLAALSVTGGHKLKHREHKSLDYVTSDFQLVWSHVRPLAAPHPGHGRDATDDFLTLPAEKQPDLPRAHLLPIAPAGVLGTEVFTCSLPSYRLYAAATGTSYHHEPSGATVRGAGANVPLRHCATLSRGTSGRLYSSPQASLRASRSWDELSTSHIYEEPQRPTTGSVEEALSELSDLVTDCPSDPASPDPPPARRRHPQPLFHGSSTLMVPSTQHPNRTREPQPLPTTSSSPSPILPPPSVASSLQGHKTQQPCV